MSEPRAILATFTDFDLVQTRKVAKLVFEVPIESFKAALDALGMPEPGGGTWCGIARVNNPGAGASTAARERVGDSEGPSPTRTNSQRAAYLLKNPDFRRFLSALAGDTPPTVTTEEQANQNLKAHFGITSKTALDSMDAGWGALLSMFKAFQQAQGHGVI